MQTTFSSPPATSQHLNWRWLALGALPVVFYGGVLGWFAYDMPYMDDYPVLVTFLNRLSVAPVGEKWRLLLEQNNFHRVVWVKAIAWLSYALTGRVSFGFLQLLGNASLLLVAGVLWRSLPTTRNGWYFLPVPFLIFQFQSWNNAFWAMAAMSNLWAPAWALLAFWLAYQSRPGWALLVGVVALLTNGNGILVLPLLLLGFAVEGRWRWVAATVAVLVPVYILYFSGYHNPSDVSLVGLLAPATLAHLLALDTAFLGSMFYHPAVGWLPQVVGWASIGWTLYLMLMRYDQTNPTLFWMLVFLQLTGLMLATNRIGNPVEAVFASRYKNITALVMAVVYLTAADHLTQKQPSVSRWFMAASLAGAVTICVVSDAIYVSKIVRFRELKQTDLLFWQRYGLVRGCSQQYDPAWQLKKMYAGGIFAPDSLTLGALQSQPVALPQPPQSGPRLVYHIDLQKRDGAFWVISGFAKIDRQKANFNDTYVGVQQPSGTWLFWSTLFHQRLDNDDSLNDKDTGFTAIIPAPTATEAPRLGLLVRSGNKTAFQAL